MPDSDQIDELCDRFEDAWQAGHPPALEEVLASAPGGPQPAVFRELLLLEREYRDRAGWPLTVEDAHRRLDAVAPWAAGAIEDAMGCPAVEVIDGPHAGHLFPLPDRGAVTVGRHPGLPVALTDDPHASRFHCVIEVGALSAHMLDLQSTAGTQINDRPVLQAELAHGDRVRVGKTVLRVRLPVGRAVGSAVPSAAIPVVPGYRLGDELGRGNLGVVYRAVREADRRTVAVKTLQPATPPTAAAIGRFLRETDVVRRLDHPHVVRFEENGAAGGVLYFVMELIAGTDAARLMAADGPVRPDSVARWAGQALDALAHAHDRGFVHRDVKPANLIVVGAGPDSTVKLTDFGLARAYQAATMSGLTATGAGGGTPAFIPPEQVTDFRDVGPAADQYGLAATLYFLLTGTHVYETADRVVDLLRRVTTEDPIPLRPGAPPLPGLFGPVIRRALARDPKERFPDARAMRDTLLGL
jgi:serine/threonine-protein kinase